MAIIIPSSSAHIYTGWILPLLLNAGCTLSQCSVQYVILISKHCNRTYREMLRPKSECVCSVWGMKLHSCINIALLQFGELHVFHVSMTNGSKQCFPISTTPDSFPFVTEREAGGECEGTALPTIVGGSFAQVANRRVDPTALPFMSNSRVEMLNCSSPSLYVYKSVLNKMLILIDEVEAKRTIILIKSGPHWCDSVECYWSLKFMLLGGSEKGTQRVVSRSVIIPHLQVFLLPQSLSSLVKRKSICTDVYEEWKIAQRKRKEAFSWKRDSENWR